jgi:hypothetical protein
VAWPTATEELREPKAERDAERAQAGTAGGGERTPEHELEAEQRAAIRTACARSAVPRGALRTSGGRLDRCGADCGGGFTERGLSPLLLK